MDARHHAAELGIMGAEPLGQLSGRPRGGTGIGRVIGGCHFFACS